MNPRRNISAPGLLALTLLLAPASAEASILDALGNLWETGKEKVGGLFESGKEAVSGMLQGGPSGGGEEFAALMGQIENAQEAVASKGDNLSEYLNRLNGRAPGAATRPFLRERMRDLETAQRTLGELYSRLGQSVSAAGGVNELTTEERQRVGLIQRQQQILVATAQQLDYRSDRALAGKPVPPAQPLDIPDGPVPPIEDEVRPPTSESGGTEAPARETAVTRPDPPAEEPAPQPEEAPSEPEPEPEPEPAAVADAAPETDTPEGVQSWGSYERMRREQEEAERSADATEKPTLVKADSADAFGGTGATQVKADDASAFGGRTQSLRDDAVATASDGSGSAEAEGSAVEEQSYGSAGRPGGTEEHPQPAGSEAEAAEGDGSTAGDAEGTVSVPGLTSQQASAPKVFDPEDPVMGAWVDEWLQAAGLDEYGRWVSPSAITANGSADTGGLPRRTWLVAVYGDKSFGTNMSLQAYIAARMKGENPNVVRTTNPDGTPLGTQPGGSGGGPRSIPTARSGGGARAGTGGLGEPGRRDAQYLKLRQALEAGNRDAVRDAYGSYTGGN